MSPGDHQNEPLRQDAFNLDAAANSGLLRRIFEALSLPFLVVDPHDYTVVYANRAARCAGSNSDANTCHALFHDRCEPCELDGHECPLARVRQTGEPTRIEHLHSDGEGGDRIVEVHAHPVVEEGRGLTHVILIHLDVTAQRRAEAVLHRSEKLTQVHGRLAAVGQLAAGIAHDFNNILQTLRFCGETLESQLTTGRAPREEMLENARIVVEQAERGSHLVRQIQDYSRKSPSDLRPLDIDSFLEGAVKLLSRILPETLQIVFATDFEDHTILGDRHQLEQVIANLAINARDAMPGGGELRIAVTRLELGADDPPPFPGMWPGPWVTIEVSDTGSGIPAAAQGHVFEPFFTTKPEGRGTGLGLSQAYGIVKQHGGYIDFSTREAEGTTFRLYFPTSAAAVIDGVDEEPLDRPVVAGIGKNILLVDDEESLLRVMQRTLEALGFEVEATSSSAEALELCALRGGQFDLLITDVLMPDYDGRDLVRKMREKNPAARCLLMSGSLERAAALRPGMPATLSATDGLAVDGWLPKPFSIDQLMHEVGRALGRESGSDR